MRRAEGEITLVWTAMWSWRGAAGWRRANLNTSIRACCLTSWSTGSWQSRHWHLYLPYCFKQRTSRKCQWQIGANSVHLGTYGNRDFVVVCACEGMTEDPKDIFYRLENCQLLVKYSYFLSSACSFWVVQSRRCKCWISLLIRTHHISRSVLCCHMPEQRDNTTKMSQSITVVTADLKPLSDKNDYLCLRLEPTPGVCFFLYFTVLFFSVTQW